VEDRIADPPLIRLVEFLHDLPRFARERHIRCIVRAVQRAGSRASTKLRMTCPIG
jgi:hypothetical protein